MRSRVRKRKQKAEASRGNYCAHQAYRGDSQASAAGKGGGSRSGPRASKNRRLNASLPNLGDRPLRSVTLVVRALLVDSNVQ